MKLEVPTHVDQREASALAEVVIRQTRQMDDATRREYYRVAGWLLSAFEHPDAGDLLKAYVPPNDTTAPADLLEAIQEAEGAGLVTRLPQPEPEPYEKPPKKRKSKQAKTAPESQGADPMPGTYGLPMLLYLDPVHWNYIEQLRGECEQAGVIDCKHSAIVTGCVNAIAGLIEAREVHAGRQLTIAEITALLNTWAGAGQVEKQRAK